MEKNTYIGGIVMEKYIKPVINSKADIEGILPAALSAAAVASAIGFATGLAGDDVFHPEHMRQLVVKNKTLA